MSGFRNLDRASLFPAAGTNLITGPNGAGKSSLLEAIHCLSVGHSYRTRKARELISHNKDAFTVTCHMLNPADNRTHRSGLMRGRDGTTELRLDFEEIKSVTDVTQLLPVKALTPDSHALIQEGPSGRRQFLDWGAFHMEHSFLDVWKQYRRALAQRNQALRDTAPDVEVMTWDAMLSESGTSLDSLRKQYLHELSVKVTEFLESMGVMFHVELRYRSGWAEDLTLSEALVRNLSNCRRFKTTTDGPHRGELIIQADGHSAKQVLSRGQQKILVYALHIAQLNILKDTTGRQAVVLCDDLMSELDRTFAERLFQQIEQLECQLFVTGTDANIISHTPQARFHVEHGEVKKAV